MNRQVSTPTTPSTAAATVSVKKVTFSQPSTRGRPRKTGDNAVSGGTVTTTGGDETHRTRSVFGSKRRRKHLVDVKKNKKTMEDSSVKPLLSSTTSDKTNSTTTESCLNRTDQSSGTDPTNATWNPTCPDYFGVKSYLHHFYETVSVKNPDLYEELEGGCKVGDRHRPTKPLCRSVWWKVAVGCGVNLLVIGIAVILVGYFVPRRPIFVAHRNELEVVDRAAVRYNYNLDVCKFIGLVVFCVGGVTVTVALLFPSFLYNYCDEDSSPTVPEVLKQQPLDTTDDDEDDITLGPPGSPTEKEPVPATALVTAVQPVWNPQDSSSELPSR